MATSTPHSSRSWRRKKSTSDPAEPTSPGAGVDPLASADSFWIGRVRQRLELALDDVVGPVAGQVGQHVLDPAPVMVRIAVDQRQLARRLPVAGAVRGSWVTAAMVVSSLALTMRVESSHRDDGQQHIVMAPPAPTWFPHCERHPVGPPATPLSLRQESFPPCRQRPWRCRSSAGSGNSPRTDRRTGGIFAIGQQTEICRPFPALRDLGFAPVLALAAALAVVRAGLARLAASAAPPSAMRERRRETDSAACTRNGVEGVLAHGMSGLLSHDLDIDNRNGTRFARMPMGACRLPRGCAILRTIVDGMCSSAPTASRLLSLAEMAGDTDAACRGEGR